MTSAAVVLDRCRELDTISASDTGLERTYLTPEHRAANLVVAGWMQQAQLTVHQDAAGNIWGRRVRDRDGAPALVLGSHLDTVPDAGSYDGMLGVTMAISVAERLRDTPLPFALEVVGFSDEEGTRFDKALLGSQAVAGTWDDAWWGLRDHAGTSLRQAYVDFGLDPRRVHEAARTPEGLVGYLEAHIEQGPHLEAADLSLGYVTSIAGARRFRVTVLGEARHAGGTPYERRRDALLGASTMVLAIERLARQAGVIATVGRLEVHPGAVNVISGRVDFSLDLRAPTDVERDSVWQLVEAELRAVAHDRDLGLVVEDHHTAPAARCAGWLTDAVVAGIRSTGEEAPLGLWSRAGHDAMAMAAVTDVAMLFVRCHDGISHHPAESVREVDVAAGLDAFEQAVLAVAESWTVRTASGSPTQG